MKIIYVAKHDSGGNDDEGAVYHALTELGHEVQRVGEDRGRKAQRLEGDLLLFHKWYDPEFLRAFQGKLVRAFWHWDLVEHNDPTLARRSHARMEWMNKIVPSVEIGFCSDGDWIRKDTSGKLVKLEQGADTRYTAITSDYSYREVIPILFTGISNGGGERRISFVNEMTERWGSLFRHVRNGVHGYELLNLVANSHIVVAPDSPATNHYWSNRVYLISGFGGFLLHPYCHDLALQYRNGEEIVFYHNRAELHQFIDYYLNHESERKRIADKGKLRTLNEHTYTHRCRKLIATIKERQCLGELSGRPTSVLSAEPVS